MGRFIEQDQTRSRLQERIAADLRAKAAERSHDEGDDTPPAYDPADLGQTEYLKGTKQTTSLAMVWLVVGLLFLITLGFFIAITMTGNGY